MSKELPVSGRSTRNHYSAGEPSDRLDSFCASRCPKCAMRSILPHIRPTEPGDPQPNPPDDCGQVHLHREKDDFIR